MSPTRSSRASSTLSPAGSIQLIERSMVRIRRSQTRRSITRYGLVGSRRKSQVAVIGVLDAVDDAIEVDKREATVGEVGVRLGIDQSRASRLVSAAVAGRLVARSVSQADARRSSLVLTERGKRLLDEIRQARVALFRRATANWSRRDVDAFAQLLARFIGEIDRLLGTDDAEP
ncbi:MAG TPA: MarR family winged helix-turn-helix transcriptional regulator [Kofleriaceae bacterium]|nr:MarR family winged helix-turn-helix transcriptional regulator [Kofleriaceae bacterium]